MAQETSLPPCRASSPASRSEGGFSLIVSLMMLIVIIILGISGSQMAINEERGSRSDRDRQIAFQAAEAAIKDAEFEIYGTSAVPHLCTLPNQVNHGNMRPGTNTCFNESSRIGFEYGCSAPPNAGLCLAPTATTCNLSSPGTCPAYFDSSSVDFLADAKGTGNMHTVAYGFYTSRVYASQQTSATLASQPVSKYPPRYIIERVPKNTSFTSATTTSDSDSIGQAYMFRVTAMGFGANPNTQVVLQAIVATTY